MNKEWSNTNKDFQEKLKKKTFSDSIEILLKLRKEILAEINNFNSKISIEEYSLLPFMNHKGYESKTVAYSIWHIFRIEDIVLNTLILKEEEIYYSLNYDKSMGALIDTTGNELVKEEIKNFSSSLDVNKLYEYINIVNIKTTSWLLTLKYEDLSKKFNKDDVNRLVNSKSISEKETWLIEYWTKKDVKGLLLMPFSRHWIMHIEAALRIIDKIVTQQKK